MSSLPYDPHKEQAIAIAPLVENGQRGEYGRVGHCKECKLPVWLNLTTLNFMAKHEVTAVCPDCAQAFAKGEM